MQGPEISMSSVLLSACNVSQSVLLIIFVGFFFYFTTSYVHLSVILCIVHLVYHVHLIFLTVIAFASFHVIRLSWIFLDILVFLKS